MIFLDSLQLFFLSPFTFQALPQAVIDPWLMLFFSLNALLLLCMIFFYHPLFDVKFSRQWWRAFINGIALSSAFSLMQWGYLIANPFYQKQGLLLEHFIFSWGFPLLGYMLLWRFVSTMEKISVKILIVGIILAIMINIQTLLTVSGINGISLIGFDALYFYLSLLFPAGFFTAALWVRFARAHHSSLKGESGVALLSGFLAMLGALFNVLIFNDVFVLSWHLERVSDHYLAKEVFLQLMLFGGLTVTAICFFGQKVLKISQQLKYEQQRNQALSNLNNGIVDAIVAFDTKGIIIFFNKAAEHLFGWQANEITGHSIMQLASNEHKDFLNIFIKRMVKQSLPSVIGMQQEFIVKHKEGKQFPARIAIGCYQYEKKTCFAATIANMQDLREQIKSQKEIVKEFQSLISNLPCLTFRELRESKPHWIYLSENTKVLTGLSTSELMTEMGTAQFIENIFAEDKQHYQQTRKKATKDLGYYDIKYRYLSEDKQIRWLWEIGYCYKTKDSTAWADGIILDISHKQDHALAKMHDQDNQLLILSSVKKFQFANRLRNITQLTNTLIKFHQNKITEHYLQLIHKMGNELEKFIQNKPENDLSESLQIEQNKFSLQKLSQKVFSSVRDTFCMQEIDFDFDYDDKLAEYYLADEVVIAQILHSMLECSLNLIYQGKLVLFLYFNDGYVRFVVACYTKHQLNNNATQQLYAPFDNQLVEQVSGDLWFDLHANGALLYVDLPLAPASNQLKKNSLTTFNTGVFSPLMVHALVIDDVIKNQHELHNIFWRQGVRLTTASSLKMLKDRLITQSIDIILLDVYMCEKLNVRQIRTWANKPVKIVALIFALNNSNRDIWLNQGFDAVIEKPFKLDAITEALAPLFAKLNEKNSVEQNESKALLFDEYYVEQRWSSLNVLFCFVSAFAKGYGNLAEKIEKSELNNELLADCHRAKNAASCLGFLQLKFKLKHIILLIEHKDKLALDSQYQSLDLCIQNSIDAAMASLGVRSRTIKQEHAFLSEKEFSMHCETLAYQLKDGKFDEKHFKKILPTLANLVPLPELAEFADSVEALELNQAHRLFLRLIDRHNVLIAEK